MQLLNGECFTHALVHVCTHACTRARTRAARTGAQELPRADTASISSGICVLVSRMLLVLMPLGVFVCGRGGGGEHCWMRAYRFKAHAAGHAADTVQHC
jgi:hypothetical protein